MIRRASRYTRTDTLFPYTTLFRSPIPVVLDALALSPMTKTLALCASIVNAVFVVRWLSAIFVVPVGSGQGRMPLPEALRVPLPHVPKRKLPRTLLARSEERSVGKECDTQGRARWSR